MHSLLPLSRPPPPAPQRRPGRRWRLLTSQCTAWHQAIALIVMLIGPFSLLSGRSGLVNFPVAHSAADPAASQLEAALRVSAGERLRAVGSDGGGGSGTAAAQPQMPLTQRSLAETVPRQAGDAAADGAPGARLAAAQFRGLRLTEADRAALQDAIISSGQAGSQGGTPLQDAIGGSGQLTAADDEVPLRDRIAAGAVDLAASIAAVAAAHALQEQASGRGADPTAAVAASAAATVAGAGQPAVAAAGLQRAAPGAVPPPLGLQLLLEARQRPDTDSQDFGGSAAATSAADDDSEGRVEGLLAACMAAPDGSPQDGGPFTVQDFVNGKPARLVPQLELASSRPAAFGVTAVTVLSLGRLDRLAGLCASWGGPLSAAVYVGLVAHPQGPAADDRGSDTEADEQATRDAHLASAAASGNVAAESAARGMTLAAAVRRVQQAFDSIDATGAVGGCQLTVALHGEDLATTAEGALFPTNALRNAALLAARMPLVLLVDGDMLLSRSLTDSLASPSGYAQVASHARARSFVVVSAFQAPEAAEDARAFVLAGKTDVQRGMADGRLQRFAPSYPQGHAPTNYERWLDATSPYAVDYAKGYEPWGILDRAQMPPFDARFRGYGLDKVSWVNALNHTGFRFVVHPEGFMVHRPHAPTAARAAWDVGIGLASSAAPAEEAFPGLLAKVIPDTNFKWEGSMAWHLRARSYAPATGPGFSACRGALPWWRIFSAAGAPKIIPAAAAAAGSDL